MIQTTSDSTLCDTVRRRRGVGDKAVTAAEAPSPCNSTEHTFSRNHWPLEWHTLWGVPSGSRLVIPLHGRWIVLHCFGIHFRILVLKMFKEKSYNRFSSDSSSQPPYLSLTMINKSGWSVFFYESSSSHAPTPHFLLLACVGSFIKFPVKIYVSLDCYPILWLIHAWVRFPRFPFPLSYSHQISSVTIIVVFRTGNPIEGDNITTRTDALFGTRSYAVIHL